MSDNFWDTKLSEDASIGNDDTAVAGAALVARLALHPPGRGVARRVARCRRAMQWWDAVARCACDAVV